ncbi:hypothetical protein DPX16_4754 [Anabarilius grahami]|uniref:Uncharacterized protein n=1 Tax=Anabarilius grahami TaxID=495550 RepID=A0A3N0YJ60_ANAGA|nr:hypothetical protein DPX16_4754 [Anabarilius grahami]
MLVGIGRRWRSPQQRRSDASPGTNGEWAWLRTLSAPTSPAQRGRPRVAGRTKHDTPIEEEEEEGGGRRERELHGVSGKRKSPWKEREKSGSGISVFSFVLILSASPRVST